MTRSTSEPGASPTRPMQVTISTRTWRTEATTMATATHLVPLGVRRGLGRLPAAGRDRRRESSPVAVDQSPSRPNSCLSTRGAGGSRPLDQLRERAVDRVPTDVGAEANEDERARSNSTLAPVTSPNSRSARPSPSALRRHRARSRAPRAGAEPPRTTRGRCRFACRRRDHRLGEKEPGAAVGGPRRGTLRAANTTSSRASSSRSCATRDSTRCQYVLSTTQPPICSATGSASRSQASASSARPSSRAKIARRDEVLNLEVAVAGAFEPRSRLAA